MVIVVNNAYKWHNENEVTFIFQASEQLGREMSVFQHIFPNTSKCIQKSFSTFE